MDFLQLKSNSSEEGQGGTVLWERLMDVLYFRKQEPVMREYHIVVTIFYLFFTLTISRILRILNQNFVSTKLQPLTGDVISTFQTIACGLENGMVRKAYGMGAYCIQTFFLGLWATWTLGNTCGNPVGNFKKYVEGKKTFLNAFIHMSCQMVAAFVAYHYARTVWYLELSSEHISRRLQDAKCVSDLNVPVMIGLLIELTATVIDVIISKTTTKRFKFERYEQFAKGLFSICLTLCGLHLTGMYLNPANATVQTYGCRGNSQPEYILVYWCGPLIGCAIGITIHQKLRQAYQMLVSGPIKQTPHLSSTNGHVHHAEENGITDQELALRNETKKEL